MHAYAKKSAYKRGKEPQKGSQLPQIPCRTHWFVDCLLQVNIFLVPTHPPYPSPSSLFKSNYFTILLLLYFNIKTVRLVLFLIIASPPYSTSFFSSFYVTFKPPYTGLFFYPPPLLQLFHNNSLFLHSTFGSQTERQLAFWWLPQAQLCLKTVAMCEFGKTSAVRDVKPHGIARFLKFRCSCTYLKHMLIVAYEVLRTSWLSILSDSST